jgi:uncharacterized protein (TIGR03437 family)
VNPVLRPIVLLLVVALPSFGQTAGISAPDQTVSAGQTVVASLSLASAGQIVAALQFDLQWDPSLSIQFTPGAQLRAASKIPYVAPLAANSLRCMITGLNQTAIADGELLKFFLVADPAASTGTVQTAITNVVATDPNGIAVGLSGSTFQVQIQSGTTLQTLPSQAVLNAASLSPGPLSPGEIITLLGLNSLPVLSLNIDGAPAPILYTGPGQINAIVPFGLSLTSPATIQLKYQQQTSTVTLPAAAAAPGLFAADGAGTGPGAILNQDYSVNSIDNPAQPGSVVMIFGSGFGALQTPATDGNPVSTADSVVAIPTATVAGSTATVLYAGAAPGLVAGVNQLNLLLPAGVAHNPGAPVVLTVPGLGASNTVTVAIQ